MAGSVYEWYGYRGSDLSAEAAAAATEHHCPFLDGACTKTGGACSILPTESNQPVIVCPARLYFRGHEFLKTIASDAFAAFDFRADDAGLPVLVPGSKAVSEASANRQVQIGVFGHGWDKEIQLPPSSEGGASYSVDFTIIAVSPEGDLLGFAPVEVQTIDTTNNYRASLEGLAAGRQQVQSKVGLNWENVSKRILPQLIVKGLMLQGEGLCTHGIYFVTPEPVFARIARRLGGFDRLREIPNQPGSITFVRCAYDPAQAPADGTTLELEVAAMTTISTSDMSIAFISPLNLPPAGAYEGRLRKELRIPKN